MNKKYIYSPHAGPVGCLPTPNIFPLANEFAKGKMFWNYYYPLLSRGEGLGIQKIKNRLTEYLNDPIFNKNRDFSIYSRISGRR